MSISMPGMGTGLDIQGMAKSMAQADLSAKSNQITRKETDIKGETAALEQLESALKDFYKSLDSLSDQETFGTLKSTLSKDGEDFFDLSLDEDAKANSYQIAVQQLASKDKWQMMKAESSKESVFNPAEGEAQTQDITIKVGTGEDAKALTITMEKGDSLEDVMKKINDHEENPGVDASIITGSNGASLTLTSKETGTDSKITIEGLTTEQQADAKNINKATNAEFTVDGLTVVSQSNKVEDAIPGLTLTLKKVTEENEPVSVDLSIDTDKMEKSVESFVDSYNKLKDVINSLSKSEAAAAGEDYVRAPLAGDSLISNLNSQLRSAMSEVIEGSSFKTLASIGIVTKQNGDLEVDNKLLDKALKDNPTEVVDLFIGKDAALDKMKNSLEIYIGTQDSEDDEEDDSTDEGYKPKIDGLIKERLEGLEEDQKDIETEWEVINKRADDLYQRYFNEFNAMDLAVQQMNSSMSTLMGML
ncbi:flagellar filament capping protein FliD [Parendozoicomonas haliclonae]|uniref:Flagellar hook-associated protein 2 n=1 Tax=Parendozoicomonas haliclonae TaxID=1960125 RepID=A0A1X7ANL0_9GAMM|nr:flagellar filament capping protein FliD [Parendozoicomonas haliclonae]SMA49670.1 Flagellar hook-associated protein 2 [Parendozoicomonas haliclonae]